MHDMCPASVVQGKIGQVTSGSTQATCARLCLQLIRLRRLALTCDAIGELTIPTLSKLLPRGRHGLCPVEPDSSSYRTPKCLMLKFIRSVL